MKRLITNLKRYGVVAILSCFTLALCGCGSKLGTWMISNYANSLEVKIQANKSLVQELKDVNIIDDKLKENIIAQMESEYQRLTKDIEGIKSDAVSGDADVLKSEAIKEIGASASAVKCWYSYWAEYYDDDGTEKYIECYFEKNDNKWREGIGTAGFDVTSESDALMQHFIVGWAIARQRGLTSKDQLGTWGEPWAEPANDDSSIKFVELDNIDGATKTIPVDLFAGSSDALQEALNERFKAPIYVLNPAGIADSDGSIDEILALISEVTANENKSFENTTTASGKPLTAYFTKLVDSNGNEVHIMNDDFSIIGNSVLDPAQDGTVPGYDFIVKQPIFTSPDTTTETKNVSQAAIRFHEFNYKQYQIMKEAIGLNSSNDSSEATCKYYFETQTDSSAGGTVKAYLIEYPVSVFNNATETTIDGKRVAHIGFKEDNTGLAINLKNSSVVVKDKDGSVYKDSGHNIEDNEYLHTSFGANADEETQSSFIVKGWRVAKIKYYGQDGTKKEVQVILPRVMLRDYLEATWAPGIITSPGDENLVCFGRKMRFKTGLNYWTSVDNNGNQIKCTNGTQEKNDVWLIYSLDDTAETIAYFIDVDGQMVGSYQGLRMFDFCDYMWLSKNGTRDTWPEYEVRRFRLTAETGAVTEYAGDADTTQPPKIDVLKQNTTSNTLTCFAGPFPGPIFGKIDEHNNGNGIVRMYAIATAKDMFDSAIYSDWINSTVSNASMSWWNTWLSENGYKYSVNPAEVEDFLANNYRYEISQDGVVILDLNTVATIQNMYDEEENIKHAKTIRTIFVVLGFLLLAYSMILAVCWILDTHTDLGLSIVNKMTFGHWTAITYEDDVPSMKQNDKSYVDGKRMLIRCILLVFIAILLIVVDVNKVIYILVTIFGEIAKKLNDLIQGIR